MANKLHKSKLYIFTKAWRETPLPKLGKFIRSLGVDGIELPVRPGYQVDPENMEKGLAEAVKIMKDFDLEIMTVAGPINEKTIMACAQVGIFSIRMMPGGDGSYWQVVSDVKRQLDNLLPYLERTNVTLGLQNHSYSLFCNTMGIYNLIKDYNPKHIAAIWDPAHNALRGEIPKHSIEILGDYLYAVNLKNAIWTEKCRANQGHVVWEPTWVRGRDGLASWVEVIHELKQHNFEGNICLFAEYTQEENTEYLLKDDLTYIRKIL